MAKEAIDTNTSPRTLTLVPPNGGSPATYQGEPEDDVGEVALAPVEPERERSGLEVAAIGVGVAAGVGLLGYGAYRLGAYLGWWGQAGGGVVIDDPKPSDGKSNGKKDEGSGGGSTSRGRATGNPPNMTGNPEGYATGIFPTPAAVRLVMKQLGYAVDYNAEPLWKEGEPGNPEVTRFQREWNRVIRGIDAGKVKLPSGVAGPEFTDALRGVLEEDGVPGKHTLNGLYVALGNSTKNGLKWRDLVSKA